MKSIKSPDEGQTAFLIAAGLSLSSKELQENLEELSALAEAAGFQPKARFSQNLKAFDPAFLIGSGKREAVRRSAQEQKPDIFIFDHPLTGSQTRNLQNDLKAPVLDRNQLIVEIFARRAKSFEGKLQVELARLLDQLSRMTGAWLGSLSRQGGGGGGFSGGGGAAIRGPGEKALETDRRHLKESVRRIRKQLQKVQKRRAQSRRERQKRKIPSFALAGCTNSGKSSLLNALAKFQAEVKDQLFVTLDPKTRKIFLPSKGPAVLTDTVGFIRRLPPLMIEAFKSTLEESATADVLLHVIDAGSPKKQENIETVLSLFKELAWDRKPVLHVFNKIDLVQEEERANLATAFLAAISATAETASDKGAKAEAGAGESAAGGAGARPFADRSDGGAAAALKGLPETGSQTGKETALLPIRKRAKEITKKKGEEAPAALDKRQLVFVSAKTGEGLPNLLERMGAALP